MSAALTDLLVVRVSDSYGNAVTSGTVTWAVSSGSGTLGGASSSVDGSGLASNTFTTAATAGAVTVTATVQSTSASATFSITATPCTGALLSNTPFASGAGTVGDPYLICTANQLNQISNNASYVSKYFKLSSDINLSGVTISMIGDSSNKFVGNFDGNNFTLSNLSITGTANNVGLFKEVGPLAIIKNLKLNSGTISAASYDNVAALVGYYAGGGWTGDSTYPQITNVHVSGFTINGKNYVGSIFGYAHWWGAVKIDTSSATSNSISAASYAGGISGYTGDGVYTKLKSKSLVTASGNYAGGLFGHWNGGTCSDSYVTHDSTYGSITGAAYVGGLAGYINNGGTFTRSFATSPLVASSGSNVGGLSPYGGSACSTCFWDSTASGTSSSTIGTALPTSLMKNIFHFIVSNFDFSGIWRMPTSSGYPLLQYETPGYSVSAGTLFASGTGTSGDPYRISSPTEMRNLAIAVQIGTGERSAYYRLEDDINLSGDLGPVIGSVTYPFLGTFDGNNHIISNITISGTSVNNVGLFGNLGAAATIKNLTISGATVIGGSYDYIGILVGSVDSGSAYWGGSAVTITNVHVTGSSVSGRDYVAPILGFSHWGINTNVTSNQTISTTVTGRSYVGGVVGFYGAGAFSKNSALANVTGSASWAGGIAGQWNGGGTFTDSYAYQHASYGTVTANSAAGGAIGYINNGGTPSRIYSTTVATASSNAGGLVGSGGSACTSCFWDTETSGQPTSSAVGVGKTTAEMKTDTTFSGAGWDGASIWNLLNGSYPTLK